MKPPAPVAARPVADPTIPSSARILSLGAGVQSSALLLMALAGEYGLPVPDAAVFADTGYEPRAVYRHLEWLVGEVGDRVPIHVVRAWHGSGVPKNIRDDTLAVCDYLRARVAKMPVYIKEAATANPDLYHDRVKLEVKHGEKTFVAIPVWAKDFTGKVGQMRRQCTKEYKLEPIWRTTRALIGRKKGIRQIKPPYADMWIGISAEEHQDRIHEAPFAWIRNKYPLRALGVTRGDCEDWLWAHYGRVVPKSACVCCFAGETEVMTPEGAKPIRELAARGHAELLVPHQQGAWGSWQDVEVRAFGRNRLWKITLRRGRAKKVIHATADHRWRTKDRKTGLWSEFVPTTALRLDDRLPTVRYTSILASRHEVEPSPFGIAHGFVYGDGSIEEKRRYGPATAMFYGAKDAAMVRYFPLMRVDEIQNDARCDYLRIGGLPRSWKKPPPLDEARGYLLGWLAGYFAADGSVSKNGRQAVLYSNTRESIVAVRAVADVLGVQTSPIQEKHHLGFGQEATLYSTSLYVRDLPESFWLLPHHRERILAHLVDAKERHTDWVVADVAPTDRIEEVYCAVVPGREMFTLADNVATGNCPYHSDGYWRWLRDMEPTDFADACFFDAKIRNLPGIRGECYLHSSCRPLDTIDFGPRLVLAPGERVRNRQLKLDLGIHCAF